MRDLKVNILRELTEMYDFDGIQIDFARVAVLFPQGHQWENRGLLTDFMRDVRYALLEVEKKRKSPLLLAARGSGGDNHRKDGTAYKVCEEYIMEIGWLLC